MGFQDPVIVLGAPRSGTSLMQRIIRGCPGFVSVAKESGLIWRRYTHPSLFQWESESCDLDTVTGKEIRHIHHLFARYALPAETWRKADERDIMRYQRNPILSAAVYRPAYHLLALARLPFAGRTMALRLVDKSVHSALWLPLVDRVFPDAHYVHVVRNPGSTISSMVAGWMNPSRFFTYDLPIPLQIPDYPHSRWNFALPPGWQAWVNEPLSRVVAYQWRSLQERMLKFGETCPDRYLRVRLEDLTADPKQEISRIADFLGLESGPYLETIKREVPVVNARELKDKGGERESLALPVGDVLHEVVETAARLGYAQTD